MIRKRKNRTFLLAVLVLLFSKTIDASASLSGLENNQENIELNLAENQESLLELQEGQSALQSYIQELNSQLAEISDKITSLDEAIASKREKIEEKKEDLKLIIINEEELLDAMENRIQYIYENGYITYWETILSSETYADMISEATYYSDLLNYDKKLILQYKETQADVEGLKEEYDRQKEELEKLQEEALGEQDRLTVLMSGTAETMQKYSADIESAQEQARNYEEAIQETASEIWNEKMYQEIENSDDTEIVSGIPYDAFGSDIAILGAIIECEAGGETYEGKIGVGAVILNRIQNISFPNTVIGVVYQKGQFTPVSSGRFAVVLARGASEECMRAAKDCVSGSNTIGDALFFKVNDGNTKGQVLGRHVFYKYYN